MGTLLATAAVTVGVVAVAKRMKRYAKGRMRKIERDMMAKKSYRPVIDLEADPTGVWRAPSPDGSTRG